MQLRHAQNKLKKDKWEGKSTDTTALPKKFKQLLFLNFLILSDSI